MKNRNNGLKSQKRRIRMITTEITRDYAKASSQKNSEPEQEQQQRKDYYQRNMYERKREAMKNSYTPNKNYKKKQVKINTGSTDECLLTCEEIKRKNLRKR